MIFLGDIAIPFGVFPAFERLPASFGKSLVVANLEGGIVSTEDEGLQNKIKLFNCPDVIRVLESLNVIFIKDSRELSEIYSIIENELRSRYLLAYQSSHTSKDHDFRPVRVEMVRDGLTARTIHGYYP